MILHLLRSISGVRIQTKLVISCRCLSGQTGEVCKKFPFFEELHKLVGRRANVVPIVINGGLGPHGPSAIHPQMPSDEETSPPGSPAVETGNIGPIIVPKTANAPPVETKPAAKPPVSTPASAKRKRGTAHAPKPSMSLSTIKSAAERAHKKRRGPEHEFLEIARLIFCLCPVHLLIFKKGDTRSLARGSLAEESPRRDRSVTATARRHIKATVIFIG